jgi:hypothetical protein
VTRHSAKVKKIAQVALTVNEEGMQLLMDNVAKPSAGAEYPVSNSAIIKIGGLFLVCSRPNAQLHNCTAKTEFSRYR